MALTVQSISDDANLHLRQRFGTTTVDLTDATKLALFTGWVDQVHKDVLHTSAVWSKLLVISETFTSAVDGSPYILTANNIRHILSVYDLKNRRIIIPYTDINYPAGTSLPPERSGPPREKHDQQQQVNAPYPQYYIIENCVDSTTGSLTQGLHLLSDPQAVNYTGTIRYFYTKIVDIVDGAADVLVIPEDGRDVMVAGVVMYGMMFDKRINDAQLWAARYESLKKGF